MVWRWPVSLPMQGLHVDSNGNLVLQMHRKALNYWNDFCPVQTPRPWTTVTRLVPCLNLLFSTEELCPRVYCCLHLLLFGNCGFLHSVLSVVKIISTSLPINNAYYVFPLFLKYISFSGCLVRKRKKYMCWVHHLEPEILYREVLIWTYNHLLIKH